MGTRIRRKRKNRIGGEDTEGEEVGEIVGFLGFTVTEGEDRRLYTAMNSTWVLKVVNHCLRNSPKVHVVQAVVMPPQISPDRA